MKLTITQLGLGALLGGAAGYFIAKHRSSTNPAGQAQNTAVNQVAQRVWNYLAQHGWACSGWSGAQRSTKMTAVSSTLSSINDFSMPSVNYNDVIAAIDRICAQAAPTYVPPVSAQPACEAHLTVQAFFHDRSLSCKAFMALQEESKKREILTWMKGWGCDDTYVVRSMRHWINILNAECLRQAVAVRRPLAAKHAAGQVQYATVGAASNRSGTPVGQAVGTTAATNRREPTYVVPEQAGSRRFDFRRQQRVALPR